MRNDAQHADYEREPQPSDGPDYHADHAAWEQRQPLRCLLGRHRWARMDTTWIMHACSDCRKERVWLP